jgi:hypothetical protein
MAATRNSFRAGGWCDDRAGFARVVFSVAMVARVYPTSNIEHPTLNIEIDADGIFLRSMFNVGCSMFAFVFLRVRLF